jgi:hypothetical protein
VGGIEQVLVAELVEVLAFVFPALLERRQWLSGYDSLADGSGAAEAVEMGLAPGELLGLGAIDFVEDEDARPEWFEAVAVGDDEANTVTSLAFVFRCGGREGRRCELESRQVQLIESSGEGF